MIKQKRRVFSYTLNKRLSQVIFQKYFRYQHYYSVLVATIIVVVVVVDVYRTKSKVKIDMKLL
jgi:hypothetical protein